MLWHIVLLAGVGIDVALFWLLPEKETHAWHSVVDWERGDRDGIVLIYYCFASVYDVEL